MSVPDANVVIVVFHMAGCEACEEYVPRFSAIADRMAGNVPIYVLDANKEQKAADFYGVTAVPVTLVLRRPSGVIRSEGGLSDGEISNLFQIAHRYV